MRNTTVTTNQPNAPEQSFDDVSADLRRGLDRELIEGLDAGALIRIVIRRAIGLRTVALPERLRRLLVGGEPT